MNMFELPDYDVTVWIHYSKFGEKLEEEILSISDITPYESTEYGGYKDMHWGFKTWDEAINFTENLKELTNNPNFIFLKASNRNDPDASIICKDERPMKKPSPKND